MKTRGSARGVMSHISPITDRENLLPRRNSAAAAEIYSEQNAKLNERRHFLLELVFSDGDYASPDIY